MKRRIVLAAIFLLAGAVVNVAVAWGCAVRINVFDSQPRSGFTKHLAVIRFSAFGSTWFWILRGGHPWARQFPDDGAKPGDAIPYWAAYMLAELALEPPLTAWTTPRPVTTCRVADARGWPMRSLYSEQIQQVVKLGPTLRGLPHPEPLALPAKWENHPIRNGMKTSLTPWSAGPWSPSRSFPRALPLRPIWSGFAVNTVLYAAILWLLIPGTFVLRRVIWLKRGLCSACGYPMGEAGVCSECGKALPRRVTVTT